MNELPELLSTQRRRWATPTILITILSPLGAWLVGCASAYRSQPRYSAPSSVSPEANVSIGDYLPANSLPARDEELWIIQQPDAKNEELPTDGDLAPGCGMLVTLTGATLTPMPLEDTVAHADIEGDVAKVQVRQRFTNNASTAADAAYAFTLPHNAVVSDFVLSIGRRHIRAILRERAEAQRMLAQATSQGLLASLLVQHGNIFTQRVANLAPGESIDTELRYFHITPFRDGAFEFDFPMIAGLRGRSAPRPPQRSGRNIALSVHVNAGFPLRHPHSDTHDVAVAANPDGSIDATLAGADKIANRDFAFRYEPADTDFHAVLLSDAQGNGGTFALLLVPPGPANAGPRRPMQAVIAMAARGPAASAAALQVLNHLAPTDVFVVLRRGSAGAGSPAPLAADSANINVAAKRLADSAGDGAFDTTASLPADVHGADPLRDRVVFLITDGQAARGWATALATGAPSVRRIIIDVSAPEQRDSVDNIARAAAADAIYVPDADPASSRLGRLMEAVSHPMIANMKLDWGAVRVSDVLPESPLALYQGRPLSLIGRYEGSGPAALTLSGDVNGRRQSWNIKILPQEPSAGASALASLWARRKLAQISVDALRKPNPAMETMIRDLALENGLLSRFTAFIAVDAQAAAIAKQP